MAKHKTAVVVLAAGKGTRMRSDLPKVLHKLAGHPMVSHALAAADFLRPDRSVVVVGPGMEDVAAAVAPHPVALQAEQRGTADAVMAAREALADFRQSEGATVLVLYADTPLIGAETLARMILAREDGAHVVVLGFRPQDPAQYGRLVLDETGGLEAIVEFRDADESQRAIGLCNSGVMAVSAGRLFGLLDRVGDDNAKGEFYLTDIVALARGDGLACAVVEAAADEVLGINDRSDLAAAEAAWQRARRASAMTDGATLVDPDSVWFSYDTQLGRDVVIGPSVIFGPGVRIADGVEIKAFCHIEGAEIGAGAIIGPFARLRPGAKIETRARVGNFVEIKNAVLGEGAKANHLAYVGDADIGKNANIGAGTITCNYDGFLKHRTRIGEGAFIGSNSALVAPVKIGAGAIVGAGSTITGDVPKDSLSIARGRQVDMPGAAAEYRSRKRAEKRKLKKKD